MVYTRYSLVKLSKEILWMDLKRIFKLTDIYPFSTKNQLENDKLAYVGFVFVWSPGKNLSCSRGLDKLSTRSTYFLKFFIYKISNTVYNFYAQ